MNGHPCNHAFLRRFFEGELAAGDEARVAEHLDKCHTCRREIDAFAVASDLWREARLHFGDRDTTGQSAVFTLPDADAQCDDQAALEISLSFLAPTDDPASLGRIGPYEIMGVVGRGGAGIVLKAFERTLNRYVAVKVLSPHLAASGAARKRFAREAEAAAAVVHEHIVPIYAVAEHQSLPYIVMQYVPGRSLQQRLEQEGPLELVEILRIGMQTAGGLAAAHAQGVVHRDVKPANILLESGIDRVLLTDFGLARTVDEASLTCSGVIAGTPQYMAPEQALGEPVDHRSDLFSLGSVLYAMCTGHSPFRAETIMGVLHRICNQSPRPVQEVNPQIPIWLSEIIGRLHERKPEKRFASAEEVAAALQAGLANLQSPAAMRKVLAEEKARQRRRRRTTLIGRMALGLGGVALLALLVVGWRNYVNGKSDSHDQITSRQSSAEVLETYDFDAKSLEVNHLIDQLEQSVRQSPPSIDRFTDSMRTVQSQLERSRDLTARPWGQFTPKADASNR